MAWATPKTRMKPPRIQSISMVAVLPWPSSAEISASSVTVPANSSISSSRERPGRAVASVRGAVIGGPPGS